MKTTSRSPVSEPPYPIPLHGSQDWLALSAMFRGMAEAPRLRANELDRPLYLRAQASATAEAYLFAALMVDLVYYPKDSDMDDDVRPQPI